MTPFREIKHNLVPLNNFYLDQTIISASYEEYGVSIIEADFTWQSTAAECSDDPAQLLLHYAWKQCPNPDQLPSAHLGHDLPDEFQGMMCSEKTPNGIDLCVYVYDDHNDDRMRRDMELLYKIRKLGALSGPQQHPGRQATVLSVQGRSAESNPRHGMQTVQPTGRGQLSDLGRRSVLCDPECKHPGTAQTDQGSRGGKG
ncbi:hypothetical protein RO3G_08875 [Rhizopus delemar RA 99-880]|uniref:Uncharacterized protein n=1 Tax=Rhizopus delemar (strain RA 99-880 / ATCC MYA-4621 / FGSC 9543 / NRRL 43880) TaxID=246409 RepID=I1C6T5_RHIO9|nr:hypothetical protein RO3G_08875 [Rhizopus delemar RA 99-880]|eukprot:EIE84165.1 hypothetical protein RO3G_08875 [Rhizopus delemar RA 99-880]